ncbi:MAG: septation protein SpoVG family protein [Culicoidibacterales bacterium]
MNVTDVRMKIMNGESAVKARASITLDNAFVVRGVKVIAGTESLYVAMPSTKDKEGKYQDTAHPIVTELRVEITEKVLAEYNRLMEEELPAE